MSEGVVMLGDIGFIIGIYVIFRLISFISRRGEHAEHGAVQWLAVLALIAVLGFMVDLYRNNAEMLKSQQQVESLTP